MSHTFFAFIIVLGRLGVEIFVYLMREKGFETIMLIEAQHGRFIFGIYNGKATSSLV